MRLPTSETITVVVGAEAAAARPPPLRADKWERTVLASSMGTPVISISS